MTASSAWLSRVDRKARPIAAALTQALAAAIRDGELQPGERLPPQRAVAERLGVDLTTVTRAYAAAFERGLTEGAVGRGTFVRARPAEDEGGRVDLSMNLPPSPEGLSLAALLRETTDEVLQRTDPAVLMAYHPGSGTLGQRASGAAWLAPSLGEVAPERVLLAPGAQAALAASLTAVASPGEGLIVEPLTYPGVRGAAKARGLVLHPCDVDVQGPTPDSLERLCRQARPRALYVVPTMQNPTATTMGPARRTAIAEIAARHDLILIEDDPYARLLEAPPPALARLAPERTIHIATLSKTLSPGLRLAYVACPPALAAPITETLRALALMPAPLMAAVVNTWMREGTAQALLEGVRREAAARRAIAQKVLPTAVGDAHSLHVWLPLPGAAASERLRQAAAEKGLALVTAEAFATGPAHAAGARISLGGPARREVLKDALERVEAIAGLG